MSNVEIPLVIRIAMKNSGKVRKVVARYLKEREEKMQQRVGSLLSGDEITETREE